MILFVLIFDLDISGDTRLTSEFHWNSIFWLCVRERTYVPRPNTQNMCGATSLTTSRCPLLGIGEHDLVKVAHNAFATLNGLPELKARPSSSSRSA